MSQQLRRLGQIYKDISTWTLLSIFLWWLLFPPIILIIKQFELASEMKNAGRALNDRQLIDFGDRELIILILNLASSLTGGITGIVGLVIEIIQLGELKDWAIEHNLRLAAEGYSSVRTGIVLSVFFFWLVIPLIIGLIMIITGYNKIGDGLSY
jgi:hypothetical protein